MKLQRNRFVIVLLLQLFAAVNAGVLFQILDRPTAGYIAGSVFVLVGLYSVYRFRVRHGLWMNLGLVVAVIHSLSAIVLLSKRLVTPAGVNVKSVYGIPMELYHQGATYLFFALMIVTFIVSVQYQLIRLRKASEK